MSTRYGTCRRLRGWGCIALLTLCVAHIGQAIERRTLDPTNSYRKEIHANGTVVSPTHPQDVMRFGNVGGVAYRVFYQWTLTDDIIPNGSTITKAELQFSYSTVGGHQAMTPAIISVPYALNGSTDAMTIYNSAQTSPYINGNLLDGQIYDQVFQPGGETTPLTWIHDRLSYDEITLAISSYACEIHQNWGYDISNAQLTVWFEPPKKTVTLDQQWSTNQSTSALMVGV